MPTVAFKQKKDSSLLKLKLRWAYTLFILKAKGYTIILDGTYFY